MREVTILSNFFMGGGLFYVNQFVSFTTFFYVCCALTDLSPAYRSRLSYGRTMVWLRSGSKHFYCPQRNCGKVMFFTPLCDSIHGWCLPDNPLGRYPSGQTHNPPGRHPSRQTPPPTKTATPVDGAHPAGMHSCFSSAI